MLLNWPSGTDDKKQLQLWEQGGDATVTKTLRSCVLVLPLALTLLHTVSVFRAFIF